MPERVVIPHRRPLIEIAKRRVRPASGSAIELIEKGPAGMIGPNLKSGIAPGKLEYQQPGKEKTA